MTAVPHFPKIAMGAAALALVAVVPPVLWPVAAQTAQPATPPDLQAEQPFLAGNDAAMTTMMADMAVRPTGDVDKDFVAMMVPHHQGAIDMAKLLLRYGKNQKLKYLAQEIIVTQQQEIAAMRLAVGEPLPPSAPSPTSSDAAAAGEPSMPASMTMAPHHHAQ